MTVAHAGPVLHAEPTRITVAHWGRLDDGELFAKTRYIDWAILMKRTFGLDVLRCPRCGARLFGLVIREPMMSLIGVGLPRNR
jgi:hypothetical protein